MTSTLTEFCLEPTLALGRKTFSVQFLVHQLVQTFFFFIWEQQELKKAPYIYHRANTGQMCFTWKETLRCLVSSNCEQPMHLLLFIPPATWIETWRPLQWCQSHPLHHGRRKRDACRELCQGLGCILTPLTCFSF